MQRLNQKGAISVLAVALAFTVLLLFGSLGFGLWAFGSREDYKKNTDKKIAAAVEIAQQKTSSEKDNEFLQKEKDPLKTYLAPEAYGSISVKYPKTWSAVVTETSEGNLPVDGYFYPNFVPGGGIGNNSTAGKSTAFALRIQVISTSYSATLKTFDSNLTNGKITATPYKAVLVPGVVGVRMDGEIQPNKQGNMVIFPLRDKTVEIWTEAKQFTPDFDTSILPSLKFVP